MSKTPPDNRHPTPSPALRAQLAQGYEARGLRQQGVDLSEAQLDDLTRYVELLQQWRRHLNLTGLRDVEQIIDVLILDSLDFLQGAFLSGSMRVLDLGSGAGVPGVPLAIGQPQLQMTLLDRSQKKMTFARRVISHLQLHHCQTEVDDAKGLSRRLRPASDETPDGRFDAVVSRGVGSVARLLSLAAPLLRPGGVLLLRKPQDTPELEAAAVALASSAWGEVQTTPLQGDGAGAVSWMLLAIVKSELE